MTQLLRVTLLVVLLCQSSLAGLILEFGQGNTPGSTTFNSPINSSLTLQLYLTQTGTETRLSSASTGLAIADFEVTLSNGSGVTPVSVAFGPGFIDDTSGNTGITGLIARIAEFESSASGNVGVTTATDGVSDNSILLGTVTLQVGNSALGPVTLTISQRPALGSFSLADPLLPSSINVTSGTATLFITAVPEPSALVLCMATLMVGLRFRTRPTLVK